jgi:hypothetical protein
MPSARPLSNVPLSAPARVGVRADALAVLPWLLIPYDSLTHLAGSDPSATSQTLPATALLSLVYLLLRNADLRCARGARHVFAQLLGAFAVMIAVTLINAAYEFSLPIDADWVQRTPTALRQALSMAMGLTTFLMWCDALERLGLRRAMRWVLVGALPSLALAAAQFLTGQERVQGFSSEPSHLADMLVFALLPACALADLPLRRRLATAVVGAGALLATFSTTGFLKALLALLGVFAARGQLLRGLAIVVVAVIGGYGLLSLYPDNYVFLILSFMQTAYEQSGDLVTGSFIDRFFGLVGPLSVLDDPHAWLGYGFGGDTVYFDRLFSPETASAIREVKGELVSISSLQGKLLMYGGVVGYGLYLAAVWYALRLTPRGHLARVMVVAVFLSSLFSLGPMFLPYVWLWLAVAGAAHSDFEPSSSRA